MLVTKGKRGQKSIWECDMCKRHFEVTNSRASDAIKKGSEKFCDKNCLGRYMKEISSKRVVKWIKNNRHPLNTKGYGVTTDGYIWIYVKGKPRNQIKLHRYIMEVHLGRELHPREIVHHKDENKLNNSLDNLEITTISEHNRIHRHFGSEKRDDTWTKEELQDVIIMGWNDFSQKYNRTKGAFYQKRHRLKKGGGK